MNHDILAMAGNLVLLRLMIFAGVVLIVMGGILYLLENSVEQRSKKRKARRDDVSFTGTEGDCVRRS